MTRINLDASDARILLLPEFERLELVSGRLWWYRLRAPCDGISNSSKAGVSGVQTDKVNRPTERRKPEGKIACR